MDPIIDRRQQARGKNLGNRQRFVQRARAQIRQAIRETLKDRRIADSDRGETVSIPRDEIHMFRLQVVSGTPSQPGPTFKTLARPPGTWAANFVGGAPPPTVKLTDPPPAGPPGKDPHVWTSQGLRDPITTRSNVQNPSQTPGILGG